VPFETDLFLLTDVPRERADARALADAYRKRWRLENVFQTLTEALVCEINTLAYPKAALFGFCVAVVAYNVLATVRAALRSEHGLAAVETQVSNYHLANEVATTYEGMMIALPSSEWAPLGRLSQTELAEFLREVASQAWLAKYPRTVRGPKKPPPKRTSGRTNHHVSTARLLHKQIQQKIAPWKGWVRETHRTAGGWCVSRTLQRWHFNPIRYDAPADPDHNGGLPVAGPVTCGESGLRQTTRTCCTLWSRSHWSRASCSSLSSTSVMLAVSSGETR
jgi:hypothetical protein